MPKFWAVTDESLDIRFLSTKECRVKYQQNKRTMTTSTAMRAMMISSMECVDDCVSEKEKNQDIFTAKKGQKTNLSQ